MTTYLYVLPVPALGLLAKWYVAGEKGASGGEIAVERIHFSCSDPAIQVDLCGGGCVIIPWAMVAQIEVRK